MDDLNNTLPLHNDLSINQLSYCFKHVANSYKFYWFLAILDHVAENDNTFISLDELSLRMLSSVWYPLDYFKLSFGNQDSFKELSKMVSNYMLIDNSLTSAPLINQIENKLPGPISSKIKAVIKQTLKRWVTYRFLSPFFTEELKGVKDQQANNRIQQLSNDVLLKDYTPYRIVENGIILSEKWLIYFKYHQFILRGFIQWHLVKFLQKHNPNVTGLTEKLVKPRLRDLKTAKVFWSKYLAETTESCIFSQIQIPKTGFSLDHFIPWSYIAHDQLWNIVPTLKFVNSSKSDSLPNLNLYLDRFCELQFNAYKYHLENGNELLLEDYLTLFHQYGNKELDFDIFKNTIGLEIENSNRIAQNLGFRSNYVYQL